MTVTADLTGPLSAIGQVAAAADETIAGLTAQNEQLQQENTDLTGQLAAAEQQIAALEANQKPPLLVGAAAGTAASFNALGVTLLRQYHQPNVIPAVWKSQFTGATDWVDSYKPNINLTQGSAVTTLAKTIPNPDRVRIVIQHEPENKDKGITPTELQACFDFYAPLFKAQAPGIRVGQCFMNYTSESRPVNQFPGDPHQTAGVNEWLTAGCTGRVKPDFILWDGYTKAPFKSPQALFDGPRRLADALIPGIEQGIAETGAGVGAGRPAWFTSLGQYAQQAGFTVLCLWNNAPYTIDTDAPTLAAFQALKTA